MCVREFSAVRGVRETPAVRVPQPWLRACQISQLSVCESPQLCACLSSELRVCQSFQLCAYARLQLFACLSPEMRVCQSSQLCCRVARNSGCARSRALSCSYAKVKPSSVRLRHLSVKSANYFRAPSVQTPAIHHSERTPGRKRQGQAPLDRGVGG